MLPYPSNTQRDRIFQQNSMAETWQRAPVVFEWFGNYDYLSSKA